MERESNQVSRFFDSAEYIAFRVFKLAGVVIGVILLLGLDISGLLTRLRSWFGF